MTELSDGKVEIANISDPDTLAFFRWSSAVRYYEEGYAQGEVFLLLTAEEAQQYADAPSLQEGELVYNDGAYVVFLYDTAESLLKYAAE